MRLLCRGDGLERWLHRAAHRHRQEADERIQLDDRSVVSDSVCQSLQYRALAVTKLGRNGLERRDELAPQLGVESIEGGKDLRRDLRHESHYRIAGHLQCDSGRQISRTIGILGAGRPMKTAHGYRSGVGPTDSPPFNASCRKRNPRFAVYCHNRVTSLLEQPLSVAITFASITGVVDFFAGLADTAARWGYWAVGLVVAGDGVVPFFPGETAIVAAAVLAAEGTLSLWLVILAGWLGAVAGDSTAYWIGRRGRGPIRRRMIKWTGEGTLLAAERMVSRRGPALVFVGRFLPGLRIGVNLSCGAGQMGYRRFLVFNSMGALVWSTQAALLGFFAGKAFASQPWVAFAVAFLVTVIVAGLIGISERRRIRRERAEATEDAMAHEGKGASVVGTPGESPEAGRGVTLD